jgi:hypothetical protein
MKTSPDREGGREILRQGKEEKLFYSICIRKNKPDIAKDAMLGGSPCHHGMALPRVADGRDGLQLEVLQLGGWAWG